MKNYLESIFNNTKTSTQLNTIISNTDLSGTVYSVAERLNQTTTDLFGLKYKFEFTVLNKHIALLPLIKNKAENNLFLESITFDFNQGKSITLQDAILNMRIVKIIDDMNIKYKLVNYPKTTIENILEVNYSNSSFFLSVGIYNDKPNFGLDHKIGYFAEENETKLSELDNLLEPIMNIEDYYILQTISEYFFEGRKLNDSDLEIFLITHDINLKTLNNFEYLCSNIKLFDIDKCLFNENQLKIKNQL